MEQEVLARVNKPGICVCVCVCPREREVKDKDRRRLGSSQDIRWEKNGKQKEKLSVWRVAGCDALTVHRAPWDATTVVHTNWSDNSGKVACLLLGDVGELILQPENTAAWRNQ